MTRLAEEKLVRGAEAEKGREAVAAGEFAVSQAEAELKLQRNELASKESQKQAEVDRLRFAADLAGRRIADETKNAQTNVDTVKKTDGGPAGPAPEIGGPRPLGRRRPADAALGR